MKYILYLLLLIAPMVLHAQHQNVMISDQYAPNEPHIAINPKNPAQIVAGANLDNLYTSLDTGNTWVNDRMISPYGVWGDPYIIVDTGGHFFYFHLANPPSGTWIDRIVCQGINVTNCTWTSGTYTGLNGIKKQDKETAIVDPKTNKFYVSWTQFDNYGSLNPADSSHILISSSLDTGNTWTTPVRINKVGGNCKDSSQTVEGAVPCIGPNGEVFVAWTGAQGILFDRSFDGGQTWLDNDISVDTVAKDWAYDVPGLWRCNGLPYIACDLSPNQYRGNIYINWTDQRNGVLDTDVWVVRSSDSGNTWSAPVRVNKDGQNNQQFFSSMTIDQVTGYVYVMFYDRRAHTNNLTDVYVAVSRDGGKTFTEDQVSASPFMPMPNIFFGDYTAISAHNNIVRPIWARLDSVDQSIWTAKVDTTQLFTSVGQVTNITVDNETVYPNPFFSTTHMSFKLRKSTTVSLQVTDVFGRTIAVLKDNEVLDAGRHVIPFDANKYGLASGVYYFLLNTDGTTRTQKIILAR